MVDYLGVEPGTQVYSAWPAFCGSLAGWNEYPARAGGVNRHIA